jgi:hypothetical protein
MRSKRLGASQSASPWYSTAPRPPSRASAPTARPSATACGAFLSCLSILTPIRSPQALARVLEPT